MPVQLPGAHSVSAAQLRQAPLPSHMPSRPQLAMGWELHALSAWPSATATHLPCESQVLHSSLQALSQQTPSTQLPVPHWPLVLQLAPWASGCGVVSGPSVLGGVTTGPSFFGGGTAASFFSSGSSIGLAPGPGLPEPEQACRRRDANTALSTLVRNMRGRIHAVHARTPERPPDGTLWSTVRPCATTVQTQTRYGLFL
jgi:hypothetical protein